MKILHIKKIKGESKLGGFRRSIGLFSDDGNNHQFFSPEVEYESKTGIGEYRVENIGPQVSLYRRKIGPGKYFRIPYLREVKVQKNLKKALDHYLSGKEFDIIYAHNITAEIDLGCYLKEIMGRPLILEIHGLYPMDNGLGGIIRKQRHRKRHQMMLRNVNAFIAQTESLARYIVEKNGFPKNKITVVKNGVDRYHFDPQRYMNESIDSFRFKEEDKIILYAGFLDEVNGVNFLLRAIEKIKTKWKNNVKFVVAGDGPLISLVKDFERSHRDIFRYLGVVEEHQMPSLYSRCEVFIIPRPSHLGTETMTPLKLLEAMAMEKLVLASDVGGIAEAMRPNREGIVYNKGNLDDFCKKLKMILEGPSNYSSIVKNARERVINEYSWEKSKSILAQLYKTLV